MLRILKQSTVIFVILTILCGVVYPLFITLIAQTVFRNEANGSIIYNEEGKAIGSELLGQNFESPQFLIGRPTEVSNLSPTSRELTEMIEKRRIEWKALDPKNTLPVPQDLITASGSGYDPNISVEAAYYQISRIAREREINTDEVKKIIDQNTTHKFLGIFGEDCVNVLDVNIELGRVNYEQ